MTSGIVKSAIEQWDREFGESYPDLARKQVLDVPTRLAVYARLAHELIYPDNGYCNQCGGHWLYRTDGTWEYTDGDHRPDCVFRRLVEEAETVETAPAPSPLEVLLQEARALLASNKGATVDVYQRSNDALRLLDKALARIETPSAGRGDDSRRLRTLYDLLPFAERMRFGGDFSEFCGGLDAATVSGTPSRRLPHDPKQEK